MALACPAGRARAADDDKPADVAAALKGTSATKVPQDAAFYYASLRNKEQLDRLLKSNAYKTLKKTQAFKLAIAALKQQLEEAGLPPALSDRLFDEKGKKEKEKEKLTEDEEFAELLAGALAEEVFIYGGKGFNDLLALYTKAQAASNADTLGALGEGKFEESTKAGMKSFLKTAQKGREAIKVPELIIGLKTKEAKKLEGHAERYEKVLKNLFDKEEKLKGKLKRDGGLLTIELDGGMVPWDDLPWDDEFGKKDDYKDLFDHLKKLTLTLTAGVKGDYLLFAMSSSVKDLDVLEGKGKKLVERAELALIGKHAKEKIASVGYTSKEFVAGAAGYGGLDWEDLSKGLKGIVEKQVKKEETKKGLNKDIDELVVELKKWTPGYGAVVNFSYMTSTGYEWYMYDYAKYDHLKGVRTNLFEHVGGDPIYATAFGFKVDGSTYTSLSKLAKAFYGHAEAIYLDSDAPQEQKDEYKKQSKAILPHLDALDKNISKNFVPALKGTSGMGIVIDGKWTSKQWHKEMPEAKKALPMLQPAVLMTVNDTDKFVESMQAFRTIFNDIYKVLREIDPNSGAPEFKIEAPNRTKGKKFTLYTWPAFKDSGLDEQVEMLAGVEKGIGTLAFSKTHAESILSPTKLSLKDGPLVAHNKELISGTLLDFPKLADMVLAWADAIPDMAPGDEQKKQAEGVMKQVREVTTILKCFQQYQSATYLEGGKLVTHSRAVFKDVEDSVEPK